MDDLERFQRDVGVFLTDLADKDKLKTINKKIGVYLRKSTDQRIGRQEEVDGAPFAPRKPIGMHSAYQRHAARQKLLSKMAKPRYLRTKYTADRLQVGYGRKMSKLARWHNEGIIQRAPAGYRIMLPRRNYMGISEDDWKAINQIVIDEM